MNKFDVEVKSFAKTPGFKDRLYLVKNGIPFDVAFSLDDVETKAFLITLAELDGHRYDWQNGSFIKND